MDVWRTFQIACPELRGSRGAACARCDLPLIYHGVRFQILNQEPGSYILRAVQESGFNEGVSNNTRDSVLRVTEGQFQKFRLFV